ncbi:helix-turn-helix domain-containing protein [[Clostridium] symbiosum]|nr:helix-turn-helix transcriptional regulator [[Clostridium] symbiosum]MDB2010571.1 helix-turn-helix transcriptional regulator [[Clostridium] symbiosum]MDB2028731.1 helix-turn-helix transcriptional regulator [[Clostridium] symbiosum]MDB2033129.1 helix-turn-helix transcriptional regulator [[Clostridium] symbiosum]
MYSKKLTIRQVSYLTGIPRSTISDICNGTIPRLDTLEDIARGLNLRISDLYESDIK